MFALTLITLTGTGLAQDGPAWAPLPLAQARARLAPHRAELDRVHQSGAWLGGMSARVSDDPGMCLEDLLRPRPVGTADGDQLAVARGVPLARLDIEGGRVEPRYLRSRVKADGSSVVVWEGVEYQTLWQTTGYQWHDGMRAGRDLLMSRDEAGRTTSLYLEVSYQVERCMCLMGVSELSCEAFSGADVRDPDVALGRYGRMLAELRWEDNAVVSVHFTRIASTDEGDRAWEAVVNLPSPVHAASGGCTSAAALGLERLTLIGWTEARHSEDDIFFRDNP